MHFVADVEQSFQYLDTTAHVEIMNKSGSKPIDTLMGAGEWNESRTETDRQQTELHSTVHMPITN